MAMLPELPLGNYRVFADSGQEGAGMFLLVSGKDQKTVRCEMVLMPLAVPETFATLVVGAPQIRLSEFRGVVQDENRAVIPRLEVEVWPKRFLDRGCNRRSPVRPERSVHPVSRPRFLLGDFQLSRIQESCCLLRCWEHREAFD
jgi:hypothetical protein